MKKLRTILTTMITLVRILHAAIGGDVTKGRAHFTAAGRMAAPAYYHTVSVLVDFDEYKDRYMKADKIREEAISAFKNRLIRLNATDPSEAAGRVYSRTRRSHKRLETVQKDVQTITEYSETRNKRMLGALLGAVSTLISVGSAVWQSHQVTDLAGKIKRVDHKVSQAMHDVRKMGKTMKNWIATEEAEIIEDRLVYDLNSIQDHSAEVMEDFVRGLYAARDHRLHPAILPPQDMVEISKEIQKHTKKTKHSPVLDAKAHLEEYPISYMLGTKGLLILIHVPFVTDHRHMVRELYYLQSATFNTKNGYTVYTGNEKFISVNKKEEVFTSHTLEQLHMCTRARKLYICTEDTIMYKTATTCIEALFRQDSAQVAKLCEKKPVSNAKPAFDIEPTSFILAQTQRVQIICSNRTDNQKVPANTTVKIQRGCAITNNQFVISPPLTETRPSRVAEHKLKFEEDATAVVQADISGITMTDLEIPDFDPHEERDQDESIGINALIILGCTAVVVTLLSAAGTTWACKRYRRRLQKKARQERRPRSSFQTSTPGRPPFSGNHDDHVFPASPPPHLVQVSHDYGPRRYVHWRLPRQSRRHEQLLGAADQGGRAAVAHVRDELGEAQACPAAAQHGGLHCTPSLPSVQERVARRRERKHDEEEARRREHEERRHRGDLWPCEDSQSSAYEGDPKAGPYDEWSEGCPPASPPPQREWHDAEEPGLPPLQPVPGGQEADASSFLPHQEEDEEDGRTPPPPQAPCRQAHRNDEWRFETARTDGSRMTLSLSE